MADIKSFIHDTLTRKDTMQYYWSIRTRAKNGSYIARYKHKKLLQKNCAYIPLDTDIAGKPVFPHGISGIFISKGAKIGKDCVIFHQVTVGSNTVKDSKGYGFPVIGDRVYIGAGAKIIGGVRIGNNVRIGANCVVVTDIPDNSTVVQEHPRVIVKDGIQDNKFMPYQLEKPNNK